MQYIMQPLGGWGARQAPEGLARLLGRAAGWSLGGCLGCWLAPGGLAGLLGRVVDWSLEGCLICWAGLLTGPWRAGLAAMLVTAQLIFSVDT